MTSEDLLTGATTISRRRPSSRSHAMEIAEKSAVMTTDIATTPGKTNFLNVKLAVVPTRVVIP
jgi:hypothetical protein